MLICPHCKGKGISAWAKIWSGSYTSAQCHLCGHCYCIKKKVKQVFCGLRYIAGLLFFFAAVLFDPIISLAGYAVFLVLLEALLVLLVKLNEEPHSHQTFE